MTTEEVIADVFDIETLKGFIAYARSTVSPKLTQSATEKIRDMYVEDRRKSASGKDGRSRIPVTVRQLEAIIRLSEARAKSELSEEVTDAHINEAHRIFTVSTLGAISSGKELGIEAPE